MRKRIIEFMDRVVDYYEEIGIGVTEIISTYLSYLLAIVFIISSPIWIIPYIIFKRKS